MGPYLCAPCRNGRHSDTFVNGHDCDMQLQQQQKILKKQKYARCGTISMRGGTVNVVVAGTATVKEGTINTRKGTVNNKEYTKENNYYSIVGTKGKEKSLKR
jgi:hypothetical protein